MLIAALFVIAWNWKTKIQTDVFPWVRLKLAFPILYGILFSKNIYWYKKLEWIWWELSAEWKKPVSKGYYIINILLTFFECFKYIGTYMYTYMRTICKWWDSTSSVIVSTRWILALFYFIIPISIMQDVTMEEKTRWDI